MGFKSSIFTQQQLQDLLQTLVGWPSPFSFFSSWEEVEGYKMEWVANAPGHWFSSLLEACIFYNKEGDDEQRNDERFELVSSALAVAAKESRRLADFFFPFGKRFYPLHCPVRVGERRLYG